MSDERQSVYIGDGVYIQPEGPWGFWLETNNGCRVTNRIFVEVETLDVLMIQLQRFGYLAGPVSDIPDLPPAPEGES